MKATIKVEREFDIKTLHVQAHVRHFEDAIVNGAADTHGNLLPCLQGKTWCPIIDIETGRIMNWEIGKKADIHFKVCDEGEYTFKDINGESVIHREGYVPICMCPKEKGYGDYIIMNIDENGIIEKWKIGLDDFSQEED